MYFFKTKSYILEDLQKDSAAFLLSINSFGGNHGALYAQTILDRKLTSNIHHNDHLQLPDKKPL